MSKKDKATFTVMGLVQIALIGLRLGRVIGWHWAWVFSPALFCAVLFCLIMGVAVIITLVQDY